MNGVTLTGREIIKVIPGLHACGDNQSSLPMSQLNYTRLRKINTKSRSHVLTCSRDVKRKRESDGRTLIAHRTHSSVNGLTNAGNSQCAQINYKSQGRHDGVTTNLLLKVRYSSQNPHYIISHLCKSRQRGHKIRGQLIDKRIVARTISYSRFDTLLDCYSVVLISGVL
jgi:hypothetical protein